MPRLSLIAVLSVIHLASLQASAHGSLSQNISSETAAAEAAADDAWAYTASTYIYIVPDDQNYASAIFTANRTWLHVEGRYNYEALRTGSAWIGYNFSVGKKMVFDATPMFGGIFGELNGVAPGWELTLSYGKLEIYSENEYVFDLEDSTGNFFYTWSQLTFSPIDWLQLGLVAQRTKVYQTDLDVQRGLFAGFTYKVLNVTVYILNLGWEKPIVSISAGLNF